MLHQQHTQTPMSGKSATPTSIEPAANDSSSPFIAKK